MIGKVKSFIPPLGFITFSGSGFVFIQFGLENSTPMAFLELRFLLAFFILLLVIFIFKIEWPNSLIQAFHIAMAGLMSIGIFAVGCFNAINYGISAQFCALIIALQPIVVSFFALRFLDEEVTKKIWLGLFLGFFGVGLVLGLDNSLDTNKLLGLAFAVLGLLGTSFGTLYQKKYCPDLNLFSGGAIQSLISAILVLPFLYFEEIRVDFNLDFFIALCYMATGASIGAISFLYIMLKNGEASKVSSLFYLIPVSSVVISFLLFGTKSDYPVLIGIFAVLIAINLIYKKEKNESVINN